MTFTKIRTKILREATHIFTGLPEWAWDEIEISDKETLGKIVNGFVNKYNRNGRVGYFPMEIERIMQLYVGQIDLYKDLDDMVSEDEYEDYDDDLVVKWDD